MSNHSTLAFNGSTVPGLTVTDALDNLNATVTAGSKFQMAFGGNFNNALTQGRYARFSGLGITPPNAALGAAEQGCVPKSGTLTTISYSKDEVLGGTRINVVINGLIVGTFTLGAGAFGFMLGVIPVVMGQALALQYDAAVPSTVPGNLTLIALVE